jgi:hypothetical protein
MATQLPQSALAALDAKSQATAAPAQPAPQPATPAAAPAQDDSKGPDEAKDEAAAETVNLAKQYSRVNAALIALLDGLAVKRSATLPHIKSQSMSDHTNAIGQILPTIGGGAANLILYTHTVHGGDGGKTVLYPTEKLRTTIIPKNSELAKDAIAAERALLNDLDFLIGDHAAAGKPQIEQAKSQLKLIGTRDGAGMNLFDFAAALIAIPSKLLQTTARLHSIAKHGGPGHAQRTAPKAQK